MNGDRRMNILEHRLLPFITIHRASHYFQEGAPLLQVQEVMQYLEDKELEVINMPGNSPDLNLIKNLWYIMK
jgi:hypothetical protein